MDNDTERKELEKRRAMLSLMDPFGFLFLFVTFCSWLQKLVDRRKKFQNK